MYSTESNRGHRKKIFLQTVWTDHFLCQWTISRGNTQYLFARTIDYLPPSIVCSHGQLSTVTDNSSPRIVMRSYRQCSYVTYSHRNVKPLIEHGLRYVHLSVTDFLLTIDFFSRTVLCALSPFIRTHGHSFGPSNNLFLHRDNYLFPRTII